MTRRNAALLAWSMLALGVVITALTLALMAWSSSAELPGEFSSRAGDYIDRITFLAFPVIGALIAARRPENPIDGCFCWRRWWGSPATSPGSTRYAAW